MARNLERFGLRRVQYSGFLGELSSNDREELIREIRKYVSGDKDSIYVLPLCSRCLRMATVLALERVDLEVDEVVRYS